MSGCYCHATYISSHSITKGQKWMNIHTHNDRVKIFERKWIFIQITGPDRFGRKNLFQHLYSQCYRAVWSPAKTYKHAAHIFAESRWDDGNDVWTTARFCEWQSGPPSYIQKPNWPIKDTIMSMLRCVWGALGLILLHISSRSHRKAFLFTFWSIVAWWRVKRKENDDL